MVENADLAMLLENLLERLDRWLPPTPSPVAWDALLACRWRKHGQAGFLQPVSKVHPIRLSDLQAIDAQKSELVRNTLQFVSGFPANNVLLWGARGTGKSALVKALLSELGERGLRLIEVGKHDLVDLPDIVDLLDGLRQRFILLCHGQGEFEDPNESWRVEKVLGPKGIPNRVDAWGKEWRHDWVTWRKMLPQYLGEFVK